jgi:hypothetical protein
VSLRRMRRRKKRKWKVFCWKRKAMPYSATPVPMTAAVANVVVADQKCHSALDDVHHFAWRKCQ